MTLRSLEESQSTSLGKYPWKNYCFYLKEFENSCHLYSWGVLQTLVPFLQVMVLQGSVADPVHFFRMRICGSGFINTDPDPDPTWYLDMLLMFSKIKKFCIAFLTKSKHPMTIKIKDQKLI